MATAEEIIRDKVSTWVSDRLGRPLSRLHEEDLLAFSGDIMTALEDADWEPRRNSSPRIREKLSGKLGYEHGKSQVGARDGTITTSLIVYWDDGSIEHVPDLTTLERV